MYDPPVYVTGGNNSQLNGKKITGFWVTNDGEGIIPKSLIFLNSLEKFGIIKILFENRVNSETHYVCQGGHI